ncbi:hypothetical protein MBM_04395 [Drepanopeziza brunnea f. sp. 'multigermtubi' MB_m1]|uniref:Uncharacterized protein n=1 Tax=Marssonina brunnea f. sp. multigermtubi (strain MB_m1) TaxID=1072389 RepID=K1XXK1_MARBU|nr:uncharacterized protein MBM_04395 [Drepanopeziza brunnea f. sp. 'multigermtubi' MB_m1]EKD17534.1 hypothetical protein MBM_04395 [Drepanopeziza brunnea f. sp. 'multigermtubi' MB_m1]
MGNQASTQSQQPQHSNPNHNMGNQASTQNQQPQPQHNLGNQASTQQWHDDPMDWEFCEAPFLSKNHQSICCWLSFSHLRYPLLPDPEWEHFSWPGDSQYPDPPSPFWGGKTAAEMQLAQDFAEMFAERDAEDAAAAAAAEAAAAADAEAEVKMQVDMDDMDNGIL